ncbi:hypothetical protein V8E55_010048 [Tylopilus felleus]
MRYDLQQAQFAYLFACHTTVGDEVIHLAAAMQFAGFRSVIGTMWAVDDAHTNAITSEFYGRMMDERGRLDHTRAAQALHHTIRRMRGSDVPIDQQILYVHISVLLAGGVWCFCFAVQADQKAQVLPACFLETIYPVCLHNG